MSNQNSFPGDKNKNDYWDTSRNAASVGSSDVHDSVKDAGEFTLNETSAKTETMTDKAKSVAEEGKHKVGEAAGMAKDRAGEGIDKAADSMDKAADMLRQKGEGQGGTVGSVAGTAADAMESAGTFLHDADAGQMMDQIEAYIRKNPTQSLLIAAGVGLVLSKAFK